MQLRQWLHLLETWWRAKLSSAIFYESPTKPATWPDSNERLINIPLSLIDHYQKETIERGKRRGLLLPEIWAKARVSEATEKPEARAMLMAGGVCPDHGMNEPQIMKIRKKDARHSATIERQKSRDRISACIGTRIRPLPTFPACSNRTVSNLSNNVVIKFSRPALVSGVVTTLIVHFSTSHRLQLKCLNFSHNGWLTNTRNEEWNWKCPIDLEVSLSHSGAPTVVRSKMMTMCSFDWRTTVSLPGGSDFQKKACLVFGQGVLWLWRNVWLRISFFPILLRN